MLASLFAAFLISSSVTVAPVGVTYHLIEVGQTPHHIFTDGLTYHPELAIKLENKDWQLDAVYFQRDTFGRPAGALVGGPKWDCYKDLLSLGAVGGVYVRKPFYGNLPPTLFANKNIEVIPLLGITVAYTQPVSERIGIEMNVVATPLLVHTTLGPKFSF